jgi:1,2-diacylglycerol 3-alpha-glucosyltransferase
MGKHIVSKLSHHFLSQVQCVIAPSEKIRRVLDNYRILRRICVVPTGIDLNKFDITLSEAERAALKADIGIPPQNKVLLTLGRLAKEKNVEQLIDYVKLMERKDISFVIVGGGPYKKELTEYVEKSGLKDKVFFTGMIVPQLVPKYYLLADIFLCASTSEAQGLTYMEAMASGLPSVCRKDLCIKNIIIDGYNGYQYTDFLSFETAVNRILDDPELHAEMSRNARELMEREFSTQAFADKIEAIYLSEIERYS